MDRDLEWTKIFTLNKDQQVNDGRLEADHMRLDYGNFTDDEEVTLLPHRKDTDDPNHPGLDIRDQIHRIHNEMTGYLRQSPFKGLVQGGPKGSDLRWSMTD